MSCCKKLLKMLKKYKINSTVKDSDTKKQKLDIDCVPKYNIFDEITDDILIDINDEINECENKD